MIGKQEAKQFGGRQKELLGVLCLSMFFVAAGLLSFGTMIGIITFNKADIVLKSNGKDIIEKIDIDDDYKYKKYEKVYGGDGELEVIIHYEIPEGENK